MKIEMIDVTVGFLENAALNWAVAVRKPNSGIHFDGSGLPYYPPSDSGKTIWFDPANNREQADMIIEDTLITTSPIWHDSKLYWEAYIEKADDDDGPSYFEGKSRIEAAMRCFVANDMGNAETLRVPKHLLTMTYDFVDSAKSDVSMVQTESWIGSDTKRADLIEIIMQVANGEYTPEQLYRDISTY